MTIFDGRYRWDGTKKDDLEPIAWFPGAYDVKLIEREQSSEKVLALKTHLCLFARTGEGQSISAQPEKFAQRICRDFSLEFERVWWVEDLLTEENRYEIITFSLTGKMGDKPFYRATRRQASPAETAMIEGALTASDRGCQP